VPVGALVVSAHDDLGSPGEAVSLAFYPFKTVQKFVYDGTEPFAELPQAFFHYCHHVSNGQKVVADIQGFEDEEGDFYIVDPVVLRPTQPSISALIREVLVESGATNVSDEKLRFDTWHPQCGQICHTFDPKRKSSTSRRACGLVLPMCGGTAGV